MKNIILLILTIFLTLKISAKDALVISTNDNYTIEQLQNDVKEIRRDQLNYKIEKDLLKETYSSNFTTVQIIISLILGIFAILGYLGLKGISSLKEEYNSELTKLKDIKSEFELKLKDLSASQEKVKEQISTIDSSNEEQNKKIKILEIKEKISSLLSQKNYQRVLDYAAIGLELSQDDIELISVRAKTLIQLRNYPEAIEAHKLGIKIDPTNASLINDLAEIYLIEGHIERYNDLVNNKKEYFKSEQDVLLTYLEALKFFKLKMFSEMKKIISDFVLNGDLSTTKNHIDGWSFSDIKYSFQKIENSNEKALFINFTDYLEGNLTGAQFNTMLNE
jgi:tetratricopeptide (TPR) repeat protein